MSSWPAFFAAALAIWLVLKGPASAKPTWVQRLCRVAIAFCLYIGFLYLLKWNPFWTLLSVDPNNRNKAEGFLILLSTLVWLLATLRGLLGGSRSSALRPGFGNPENHAPRPEQFWPFIKKVAIFHYFNTRK
jgi:hypothetical protein